MRTRHRVEERVGGEVEADVDVVARIAEPLEAAFGQCFGDQYSCQGVRG
mgnify:CR=1 FL=1